ncbi:MAG TPA: ABC transporter ATP-binding protein [Candidatus Hydrogenedentes bacterium]|nr:ABC transporter ATP-binding protein [Candidatus Hydrogenedentota bacterium]
MDMMSEYSDAPVAKLDGVAFYKRRKPVLCGVNLCINRGRVVGVLSGDSNEKNTLVRQILGLLKPSCGHVEVFGEDPVRDPQGVLARIGWLSEDRNAPGWMRVNELLRFVKAFYPDWDDVYCEELRQTFGLALDAKIKKLSPAGKTKAGLLAALPYRPALLLLEDPFGGLETAQEEEKIVELIRTAVGEGHSVLVTSSKSEEIERVADEVVVLHFGQIVLAGPLEEIKSSHFRVTVLMQEDQIRAPELPGALHCEGAGRYWTLTTEHPPEILADLLKSFDAEIVEHSACSLADIVKAHVGQAVHVTPECVA